MKLTEKEIEILKSLVFKNRFIAQMQCVEITTVRTHINNIFKKLKTSSRAGALIKALKQKIINLEDIITD